MSRPGSSKVRRESTLGEATPWASLARIKCTENEWPTDEEKRKEEGFKALGEAKKRLPWGNTKLAAEATQRS